MEKREINQMKKKIKSTVEKGKTSLKNFPTDAETLNNAV